MFAADGVGGGWWWVGGGALKDTDAIFALQITDEITAPGRRTFGKAYPNNRGETRTHQQNTAAKAAPQFKYNCSN